MELFLNLLAHLANLGAFTIIENAVAENKVDII